MENNLLVAAVVSVLVGLQAVILHRYAGRTWLLICGGVYIGGIAVVDLLGDRLHGPTVTVLLLAFTVTLFAGSRYKADRPTA